MIHSFILSHEAALACEKCLAPLIYDQVFVSPDKASELLRKKHDIMDWRRSVFGEESLLLQKYWLLVFNSSMKEWELKA